MKRSIWLMHLSITNNRSGKLSRLVQQGCRDLSQRRASDKLQEDLVNYYGDDELTNMEFWYCLGYPCICYYYNGLCAQDLCLDFNCPRMNAWSKLHSFETQRRISPLSVVEESIEEDVGVTESQMIIQQLNGVNGEVTGLDDMAKKAKQQINDDNKRRRKEAETNRHSRPPSQDRNPDNAARRIAQNEKKREHEQQVVTDAQGKVASESKLDLEVAPLSLVTVQQESIKYYPAITLADHLVIFTVDLDFKFLSNLSPGQEALLPGTIGSWIRKGNKGFYTNEGTNQFPSPEFVLDKTIKSFGYTYHDGSVKYKDLSLHRVFIPLHKLLLSRWQKPKYSLSVETAMRNFVTKTLAEAGSDLPGQVMYELQKLFDETLDYYIFTWIAEDQRIMLNEVTDPLKNPSYIFKTAWYNQHTVIQNDTFLKIDVRPRIIEYANLKIKNNIALELPGVHVPVVFPDFTWVHNHLRWDYDLAYSMTPDFLTKKYVSVGMDLIPGCWDRSDTTNTLSYQVALYKRLMAQRDNEQVLWLNQQRWLADVANRQGPSPDEVYKLLGVELVKQSGSYYYIHDPYYDEVASLDARLPNPHHLPQVVSTCLGDMSIPFIQDVSPVLDVIDQFVFDTSRFTPAKVKDSLNTTAQAVVDGAFTMYAWLYSVANNREEYARLPGPKRQQRLRIVDNIKYLPITGNCNVTAYLKDELDKLNPNKPSRIFTSYGKESSFLDPALISIVKKRISGRITRSYNWKHGKLTIDCYTFTTPKTTDLEHLFKEMANIHSRPNTIVFGCFSDDSVIAWNLPSGIGYANIDISSCDSSNGPLIFDIVGRCLMQLCPESGLAYLKQCRQKIHCVNPQNPSQWFKIAFPTCFEGSGTSLTTILNTIASALICFGIIEVLVANPDANMTDVIISGASLVGHKVTVDHCLHHGRYVLEKIQFLKFSPLYTVDGRLIPVRNTGCIIRGLGKIFGDLTPKQIGLDDNLQAWNILSASERFDRYISSVVAGYKNEAHHPLLDGLRKRFNTNIAATPPTYVEMDGDYSSCEVAIESYMIRYEVTPQLILHQYNLVQELRLGSVVHYTPFLVAMEQDYGMERREATPTEGTFTNMGVEFKLVTKDSPPLVDQCNHYINVVMASASDCLSGYIAYTSEHLTAKDTEEWTPMPIYHTQRDVELIER